MSTTDDFQQEQDEGWQVATKRIKDGLGQELDVRTVFCAPA
jgi:hypothetical protein